MAIFALLPFFDGQVKSGTCDMSAEVSKRVRLSYPNQILQK